MLAHKLFFAVLILLATSNVIAADAVPTDTLRARFPQGIPWKVQVINPDGKSRGDLELLITSDHARSCMGEVGEGFRVDFIRPDALPPPLPIASYGIATFIGNRVKIDLTGGTCDAYLVMDGMVASDGSSSGDIYTFGPGGEHNVGTYRALVR
jgi:hypothetical protein